MVRIIKDVILRNLNALRGDCDLERVAEHAARNAACAMTVDLEEYATSERMARDAIWDARVEKLMNKYKTILEAKL